MTDKKKETVKVKKVASASSITAETPTKEKKLKKIPTKVVGADVPEILDEVITAENIDSKVQNSITVPVSSAVQLSPFALEMKKRAKDMSHYSRVSNDTVNDTDIHYTNVKLILEMMTPAMGHAIPSRRITGLSAMKQRAFDNSIKIARFLCLVY